MSKVWLITGASRGLGRAFTEAVLKAGDRVVAAARNPKQLAEFESEYGENIRSVPLDVTNEDQAMAAFGGAIATLDPPPDFHKIVKARQCSIHPFA